MKKKIPIKVYEEIKPRTVLPDPIEGEIVREGDRVKKGQILCVIDTIRLFLRTQWRLGALFGRTEREAFFIICDRTTMTQDDVLNGRLICEIGIAPVHPAEFVIFRIFQHTAEAQT